MSDALNREVFHVIRRLMQEHTARWQQVLPSLTKPQYAVLRAVELQPGIEQLLLVDAAASSKATLAEMLIRLEQRGLIERRRDDADRRRRLVHLTADGRALLEASVPLARRVDEEFTGRLSAAERGDLLKLLAAMQTDGKAGEVA